MLLQRPPNRSISEVTPADFGSNVIFMVAQGRADYGLDYPSTVRVTQTTPATSNTVIALPVQGATSVMPVGIACSRTAWGRQAILAIDGALSSDEGVAVLEENARQLWPRELQAQYGAGLNAFLAQRRKGAEKLTTQK